jgi:hypothetical protein
MAVQFRLGLFPQWNYRISCGSAANPVFNGSAINLNHLMRRLHSTFATASDLESLSQFTECPFAQCLLPASIRIIRSESYHFGIIKVQDLADTGS